jgi:hypothetical protein
MSVTAKRVLDRAEELGMLDPKVVEQLRQQVSESKFHISAEAVVKLLVDRKHLTQFQAKKLVEQVTTEPPPNESAPAAAPAKPKAPPPPAKPSSAVDEDDLLNIGGAPSAASPPSKSPDDDIVDLEEALPATQVVKAAVKPIAEQPATRAKNRAPSAAPSPAKIEDDIVTLEPAEQPKKAKPERFKTTSKPDAAAAPPAAAPSPGLAPLAPLGGLAPLDPSAPLGGLQPLSPAGGLSPLAPAGGLSPLAPAGGLAPLGSPGDPLLGTSLGDMGVLGPPPPPPEEPKSVGKKRLARGWDSPLLLIGGGGLGILAIAFVVLYFALTRGTAQELLDKANEEYRGGHYATAAQLFQQFAEKHPDDPNASLARVRVGMSNLHATYDGQKDMTRALQQAKQTLPQIEQEEQFEDARSELESMLPAIADSFATSARTATDLKRMQDQVALAHEALKLVNNPTYLPTTRRQKQQALIEAIQEKVRFAERTINQGQALAQAMDKLRQRLAEGDIKGAYQVRANLLQDYPPLVTHPDVVKNTLAIANREKELVTTEAVSVAAATDDVQLANHRQIALVAHTGDAVPVSQESTSFQLLRGTVYAFDVATGRTLWRRYVGIETSMQPIPIAGDLLVFDERSWDVLRLAGRTGKLVWRQDLGEKFAAPAVGSQYIALTLDTGRVVRVNAETGELDRAAQLPHPCTIGAAIDNTNKLLLQPAEHSTIFALAADDSAGEPLSCRATYYLGHEPASLLVPPVALVGYLFVFQSDAIDSSQIHAFRVSREGTLEPAREPIRLRGRVVVPPTVARNRLIVVSDRGDIVVADVDPANEQTPISVTAQLVGGASQPVRGYAAISGSRLWVADTRLAEYEIQATRQTLDRGKTSFSGEAFVSPLQTFGGTLVHVRQRPAAKSFLVTGLDVASGKHWQTSVSSPIVGLSSYPEQRQFSAVTGDGVGFEIPADKIKENALESASSAVGGRGLSAQVALPGGGSIFPEILGTRWAVRAAGPSGAVRRVDVAVPADNVIAARPAAFGGGVLTPMSGGSLWLLDAETGEALSGATPFQPEITPNAKVKWLPPVVVDERQCVAVDAARKAIYLVRREEKPAVQLLQSRVVEVDYEPLAVGLLRNAIVVAARSEKGDELISYRLPDLGEQKRMALSERLTSRGFEVLGQQLFCELGSGELIDVSADLEVSRRVRLPNAPLAGPPLNHGGDWIVVGQFGRVARWKQGGEELTAGPDIGQPLSGAMQIVGSNLLAGGADGTLHFVSIAEGK